MYADRHKELKLAEKACRIAQVRLADVPRDDRELDISVGREWKVKADRLLESVIIPNLQKESDYPILSEESGIHKGAGEECWIVDPLDGSANFLRGLPIYCISVGLWKNNQPILGAVLDSHNKQLFSGIVGRGAKCNGREIRVRKGPDMDPLSSVLCTGFPAGLDHTKKNVNSIVSLISQFGKVRMLGSAALMLCYVASGRCDSYWERRIRLWDVAAGLAIVASAGGQFTLGEISEDFRVDVEAACTTSMLVSQIDAK
jgi:myo-inositol-1(or 4)-monophosphatase